jgi:hypothetical protein
MDAQLWVAIYWVVGFLAFYLTVAVTYVGARALKARRAGASLADSAKAGLAVTR